MQPFTEVTGIAAPLPMVNVDTDKIIPAKWLKTIERTGLGVGLFEPLRLKEDGTPNPDFVLNQDRYKDAKILIALGNFGCGSSREHAPWALLDYGISCVIAPSFADIFFNNCFKNGLLPVVLPEPVVEELMQEVEAAPEPVMTVDLERQTITRPGGGTVAFEIDPFLRHCLLEGLDDIGLTLQKAESIAAFEERQRREQPWLHPAA
jgi:3-isopropylmalate/(R)-2-methylmalate dehydratase small subunit